MEKGIFAIIFVFTTGCSYNVTTLQRATEQAEADAQLADEASSAAEATALRVETIAKQVEAAAANSDDCVRRANDAAGTVRLFNEATHPGSGTTQSVLDMKPWHLIVPPTFVTVPYPMDDLPFNQWFVEEGFNSFGDCKRGKSREILSSRRMLNLEESSTEFAPDAKRYRVEQSRLRFEAMQLGRCEPSDRFKH